MRALFSVFLLAVVGSLQAQIVAGQLDTFQDGTKMGWTGGASPVNIATGGPAGAGDRYLGINSTGGNGPASRLAVYNDDQWAGNYLSAGVTHIQADFRNEGSTNLELRLVLFTFGSPIARYTSSTAFALAAGSGWQRATFSVSSADLVRVEGTATYLQTITNVSRLMFRHDAGTPSAGGSAIVGRLGIDNVLAVPEPATTLLIAAAVAGITRSRAKRRR